MFSKACIVLLISAASMAFSQYEPNKDRDMEANLKSESSKAMSFQYLDNRQPPEVRLAPAMTTRVKFPRELKRCEDATDVIEVTAVIDEGGTEKVVDARTASAPFYEARFRVNKDSDAVKKATFSMFDLPRVNVLCDFQNGETVAIYVKITADPHLIVKLVEKEDTGDEALLWLLDQQQAKSVPLQATSRISKTGATPLKFGKSFKRLPNDQLYEVLEKGKK